ncbi:MAG: glycosyltransferase family 61 protein [Candidatus Sericytochromatia bacterium]
MASAPTPEISLFSVSEAENFCRVVEAFDVAGTHPDSQALQVAGAHTLRCQPPLTPVPALARPADFLGRDPAHFGWNYIQPERWLYALPEGRLLSSACVLLNAQGQALQDHYLGPMTLAQTDTLMFQQIVSHLNGRPHTLKLLLYRHALPTRWVQTPCYLPFDSQHANYHHWLIETLPALLAYRADPIAAQCRLLLPDAPQPFQSETLDLLGIAPASCLRFDGGDWRFDTLYVPPRGRFEAALLRQTQRALQAAAGVRPAARGHKRYYLSRQDARQRQVSNEAEVIRALEPLGFDILQPGRLSLREQIEIFADAAVIAGPHGAGLTNLLFAPPGCLLLDLQPEPTAQHPPNHCFWVLATALEQPYSYLFCSSSGPQQRLEVPVSALLELLKALEVGP